MKFKKKFFGHRENFQSVETHPTGIENMRGKAKEIQYGTIYKQVGPRNLSAAFPQYDWGKGSGKWGGKPTMKNDTKLSYWSSVYNGRECAYVLKEGTAYIFI